MPNISLCGLDAAGGTIGNAVQQKVSIDGLMIAMVGDPVSSHGKSPHNSAVMVQGSSKLTINGIPVVFAGCAASCGHAASGVNPKVSVDR